MSFASILYPDGSHRGHEAIAAIRERIHVGGERLAWQFFRPAASGAVGYARY